MKKASEVGVVIVTFNALPYLERCLESVRGYETVVVDHGSNDGDPGVRSRAVSQGHPVTQRESRPCGRLDSRHRITWLLPLSADPERGRVGYGDTMEETCRHFADAHPNAAMVGPQLRNPDGTMQRSMRGFTTSGGSRQNICSCGGSPSAFDLLRLLREVALTTRKTYEADWVVGAALLVRTLAVSEVGLPDEGFFLFGEEKDWCYRFNQRRVEGHLLSGARVAHVGGASARGTNGARARDEAIFRYMAKHQGERAAERSRKVMLAGTALRGMVYRGEKRRANLEAARWLRSGSAAELLS